MYINVRSSESGYVSTVLNFLNPILGLRPIELTLLSRLLAIYLSNRGRHSDDVLSQMLLATKSRKAIQLKLRMSPASFNNCICRYKKLGILVQKDYGYDFSDKLKFSVVDGKIVLNINILVDAS